MMKRNGKRIMSKAFQLNQFVLPAFYVILLSISLLLREIQYFN
ncbi:hypothetical protein HMPREF1109_1245 [Streptococcus intermedius SK54 = ATCC 27335]|nr:hypothetical protein HMPREF1109_1245 [Streptococcus intermedius SK54 = ATCC 27335]